MERKMQEDSRRDVGHIEDMCEGEGPEVRRWATDLEYDHESSWKKLEPALVGQGEHAELERYRKMELYEYVPREEAV